jgi:hypothetical protein
VRTLHSVHAHATSKGITVPNLNDALMKRCKRSNIEWLFDLIAEKCLYEAN